MNAEAQELPLMAQAREFFDATRRFLGDQPPPPPKNA